MQSSGVITITTDFGHKGPFAGVMKGVILTRFPAARIVDLAHDIPAHWPPEAGFWLSRSYRYFPAGTVHIAIVDPGVGTDREIIVAECGGHCFLAPDNGLLAPVLSEPDVAVYRLDPKRLSRLCLPTPSLTFQGRDVFAPVAAEIAAGRLGASDVGQPFRDWAPSWLDDPIADRGRVSGVVVTIDTFGNLISNIEGELIAAMHHPVVSLAGHRIEMKATYGRAVPGSYLGLVNSFGVLEIARAEGSAAEGLGVDRGAPVVVNDSAAPK
ncbi:MAG: SAM-dependent chlorinase/fluorinase [Gammaproteobacteria bacterium]|nr:SAM-dependent chlorinase/fluorinase [Gammaproteobacteria bacterium]MDH4253025.1 SAM-dependent chlorinase/fluorinase [Gammaproteobacteria bacterium]MDH5308553.1 SAM-dependent chlorinase/fluorinase [Gammaproteobacteria bacterium]